MPASERQPTKGELIKELSGAVGWVTRVVQIGTAKIAHGPALAVISRSGVGRCSIDAETADRARVRSLLQCVAALNDGRWGRLSGPGAGWE